MHENYKILLEQDKCLVLQPELAKLVGRSAALLFQQIHYWLSSQSVVGIHHQGKKWIYNTYEGWADDLKTVSKTTINRSIRKLKDFGLIVVEQLWAKKGNRTNHYTINYDRLAELFPSTRKQNTSHTSDTVTEIEAPQSTMDSPLIQSGSFLYRTKNTNKKVLINHNSSHDSQINLDKKVQEKPIAQQMIDIWNKIISPEVTASLNPKRAKFLIAALRHKFANCLRKWENYCRRIASSDYLMGKIKQGFQIALEVALKFDFIQRIFEKQFGIKEIEEISHFSEELITPDLYPLEEEGALEIRKQIVKAIGGGAYQAWFGNATMEVTKDQIVVYTESKFRKDWIVNNYLNKLENMLATKINIQINKTVNPQ